VREYHLGHVTPPDQPRTAASAGLHLEALMEQSASSASFDTVVKVGGAALRDPGILEGVALALTALASRVPVLVVPGGGPFADAVRDADRRFSLSDDAAHWMAILAMDQAAALLADRFVSGRRVTSPEAARAALLDGSVPVLAPGRWLRECDPLPHSWAATSDSVAAGVAGRLGARRLVLVKPPGSDLGHPEALVDPCFKARLPAGLEWSVVTADQPDLAPGASSGGAPQSARRVRTRSTSI
jgi:aspartokinase-like uncharacterized kinase